MTMARGTKKRIFQSLCELIIRLGSMDEITVTMLVQECDISRQTFYYHFSDIESLLRWGVQESTAACVQSAVQASNVKEATENFFTMLNLGSEVLTKLLESSYGGYTTLLIKDSVKQYIAKFAPRFADESLVNSPDAIFILDFVSDGITGGIISSLYEKRPIDVAEVSEKLETLIFNRFLEA